MEVSIFSISKNLSYLGGFPEVKRGEKLPIRLEMSVNCWNCPQVSYFRQETLFILFLTPEAYLEPDQISMIELS